MLKYLKLMQIVSINISDNLRTYELNFQFEFHKIQCLDTATRKLCISEESSVSADY